MQEQLIAFIEKNQLIKKGDKLLLAVSGGLDSMVMTHLFHLSEIPFGIAHCNFQLRSEESDHDEAYVQQAAALFRVPFFTQKFNTKEYAARNKQSIQMAARTLRYEWLEQTRKTNHFQLVATAHHLDDSIETLFLNMTRGTGISGLTGIPKKTGKVIRPLLFATKKDIQNYASQNHVEFREDHTNRESAYKRNHIRHHLVPVLKELNPSLHQSLQNFFDSMEATAEILHDTVNQCKTACVRYHQNETHIVTEELLKFPGSKAILFELIREYGFNPSQSNDIYYCISGQPGKQFSSPSHYIIKDRNSLIITAIKDVSKPGNTIIHPDTQKAGLGAYRFQFSSGVLQTDMDLPGDANTLLADLDKLQFPLELRYWKAGDHIIPLGMKGRKKISDLLTDEKIPLNKKKVFPVFISGDAVVWAPGLCVSDETKITKNTKNYFLANRKP